MSSYKSRKATLKAIAESRDSAVISYVTGDRRQLETQISPEIIDLFVEHLDGSFTGVMGLPLHETAVLLAGQHLGFLAQT